MRLLLGDQPNLFCYIFRALKKEGQETYVVKTKKTVFMY